MRKYLLFILYKSPEVSPLDIIEATIQSSCVLTQALWFTRQSGVETLEAYTSVM